VRRVFLGIAVIAVLAAIFFQPFFGKDRKETPEVAPQEETLTMAAPEAVIIFTRGSVRLKYAGYDDWIEAAQGAIIKDGDTIETGDDAWAEIGFGKELENAARIKENTRIRVSSAIPTRIDLLNGDIRSLVEKLEGDTTFEVKTPTAICGARGTGWDTSFDGEETRAVTYESEIYFKSISPEDEELEMVIVKAGKSGTFKGTYEPIIVEDAPTDVTGDWDDWKRGLQERKTELSKAPPKTIKRIKMPKVWIEKTEEGDFRLMVTEDDTTKSGEGTESR